MASRLQRRGFLAGAAAAALAGRDAEAGFPIFDLSSPHATVNGITASPATGSFGSSQVIHFTVNFNQVVNVGGAPFLNLNTSPAATASYSSGSGSPALVFSYTVGSSDTANPLAVTSASLNGGFIGNALGAANLSGASATFSSLIIAIGTSAPTVSAIADNGTGLASGSTAGNRPVTITGTNFAGATGVAIGGVPAVGVVVVNSNTITCRTGPHAAGLVSIAVTTPSGTGANTLYTYNLVDGAGTTLTLPTNGGASATWGFSTLSFQDEFNDLLSVQVNASDNSGSNYVTPAPGYNWYTQNFGWANTKFMGSFQDWLNGGNTDFVNPAYQFYLSQYFSVVSSVLTMVGHTTGPDTLGELNSTAFVNNAAGFVGTTINSANGWYIEIRCATLTGTNTENAFWAVDNRILTGQITDTYTEVDFFESHPSQQLDINTLQWNSNFASQGLGHSSLSNGPVAATFTLNNNFHVYGALFVPGSRPGGGFIHYFIDGSLHSEVSVNIPNGAIGTLARELLELKLQTNSNTNDNPFQIDYVRVWQQTVNG